VGIRHVEKSKGRARDPRWAPDELEV